jgi:hypothetical protein
VTLNDKLSSPFKRLGACFNEKPGEITIKLDIRQNTKKNVANISFIFNQPYKDDIILNKLFVNSINTFNIKFPKIIKLIKTVNNFGTKLNVCSCICVVACKILITNPTTIATSSIGPAIRIIFRKA